MTTTIERVSLTSQRGADSHEPSINADGRYVVFTTIASDLVPGDTNIATDVFMFDRTTNTTTRISVGSDGAQGNGGSYNLPHSISADGRFIAFASEASNLVGGDTNGVTDVFVYDSVTHTTERVSVGGDGTQANGASGSATISADGRFILFDSDASNLVPGDVNEKTDTFIYDRVTHTTTLISNDVAARSNNPFGGTISADGQYAVFAAQVSLPGGGNVSELFLYDRNLGTTVQLTPPTGYIGSRDPSISADGRYVTFESVTPGLHGGKFDVFLYDRVAGTTELVSAASDGAPANGNSFQPSISSDGRYVVFGSEASNLISDDTNGTTDVFVYDRIAHTIERISVTSDGLQGNDTSNFPVANADGTVFTFISYATNFFSQDINSASDVFVVTRTTAPPANLAPVASNISTNANEDTNDPIVKLAASFTDADLSDTFTFSTDMTGTAGKVTNNNDRTFTYDPNGKFEYLGVGETATDTFTYTVTDNHGASSTATATVTIHGENDAPFALPDLATVQKGGTVAGNVRANDIDPDIHDTLQVSAVSFGSTAVTVTLNAPAAIKGALGTLRLNADGSYSYKALAGPKSGQDVFTYTVDDGHGGQATSALVVTVQPVGVVKNDSTGLQTAAQIFSHYGTDGEIVVLAQLADAAYHLLPVENTGIGINAYDPVYSPIADRDYNSLHTSGLRLLTPADFSSTEAPSLSPTFDPFGHPDFPTTGLINGIYLNGNAAALVSRSTDSLFIAFRGLDDLDFNLQDTFSFLSQGTPDLNDVFLPGGMNAYYTLLQPLVTALDHYLSAHPDIAHVYVTGHSLGASMAQRFMSDDILDHHAGVSFQAITFANLGFPSSSSADDPRITNVEILDDAALAAIVGKYPVHGDIYRIIDSDGNAGASGAFGLHHMALYDDAVQFLSQNHISIPQNDHQDLATNGRQDLINAYTDITYSGSTFDPWVVTQPTGVVPSPFHIFPDFDPRTDKTTLPHNIIGVLGGGALTGGAASDTFTFAQGFGQVTVTNFQAGEDVIQIDHSLFGSAKAVLANTHNVNGHAVITYDASDTISLPGVTTAQLHLTDFHIV